MTDGNVPTSKCDHIYPDVYVSVCEQKNNKGREEKRSVSDNDDESVSYRRALLCHLSALL